MFEKIKLLAGSAIEKARKAPEMLSEKISGIKKYTRNAIKALAIGASVLGLAETATAQNSIDDTRQISIEGTVLEIGEKTKYIVQKGDTVYKIMSNLGWGRNDIRKVSEYIQVTNGLAILDPQTGEPVSLKGNDQVDFRIYPGQELELITSPAVSAEAFQEAMGTSLYNEGVQVKPKNSAPEVAEIPTQTIKVGESVDLTQFVTDKDGDDLEFSPAFSLPEGVSLKSGVLSASEPLTQSSISLYVKDPNNLKVPFSFDLVVENVGPTVENPIKDSRIEQGSVFMADLQDVFNRKGGSAFTYEVTGLPGVSVADGNSLQPQLRGRVTRPGTYNVTVTATNDNGSVVDDFVVEVLVKPENVTVQLPFKGSWTGEIPGVIDGEYGVYDNRGFTVEREGNKNVFSISANVEDGEVVRIASSEKVYDITVDRADRPEMPTGDFTITGSERLDGGDPIKIQSKDIVRDESNPTRFLLKKPEKVEYRNTQGKKVKKARLVALQQNGEKWDAHIQCKAQNGGTLQFAVGVNVSDGAVDFGQIADQLGAVEDCKESRGFFKRIGSTFAGVFGGGDKDKGEEAPQVAAVERSPETEEGEASAAEQTLVAQAQAVTAEPLAEVPVADPRPVPVRSNDQEESQVGTPATQPEEGEENASEQVEEKGFLKKAGGAVAAAPKAVWNAVKDSEPTLTGRLHDKGIGATVGIGKEKVDDDSALSWSAELDGDTKDGLSLGGAVAYTKKTDDNTAISGAAEVFAGTDGLNEAKLSGGFVMKPSDSSVLVAGVTAEVRNNMFVDELPVDVDATTLQGSVDYGTTTGVGDIFAGVTVTHTKTNLNQVEDPLAAGIQTFYEDDARTVTTSIEGGSATRVQLRTEFAPENSGDDWWKPERIGAKFSKMMGENRNGMDAAIYLGKNNFTVGAEYEKRPEPILDATGWNAGKSEYFGGRVEYAFNIGNTPVDTALSVGRRTFDFNQPAATEVWASLRIPLGGDHRSSQYSRRGENVNFNYYKPFRPLLTQEGFTPGNVTRAVDNATYVQDLNSMILAGVKVNRIETDKGSLIDAPEVLGPVTGTCEGEVGGFFEEACGALPSELFGGIDENTEYTLYEVVNGQRVVVTDFVYNKEDGHITADTGIFEDKHLGTHVFVIGAKNISDEAESEEVFNGEFTATISESAEVTPLALGAQLACEDTLTGQEYSCSADIADLLVGETENTSYGAEVLNAEQNEWTTASYLGLTASIQDGRIVISGTPTATAEGYKVRLVAQEGDITIHNVAQFNITEVVPEPQLDSIAMQSIDCNLLSDQDTTTCDIPVTRIRILDTNGDLVDIDSQEVTYFNFRYQGGQLPSGMNYDQGQKAIVVDKTQLTADTTYTLSFSVRYTDSDTEETIEGTSIGELNVIVPPVNTDGIETFTDYEVENKPSWLTHNGDGTFSIANGVETPADGTYEFTMIVTEKEVISIGNYRVVESDEKTVTIVIENGEIVSQTVTG